MSFTSHCSLGTRHSVPRPQDGYTALHLPAFSLEVLFRHQPEKRRLPCVLISDSKDHRQARIEALTRSVARHGVEPGLSLIRARARCPDLHILERDPDAEALALRDLLQLVESLTPDFELTTADTLILETSALHLPHSGFESLGLPLRLANTSTPDLAHLFSLHPATSLNLLYRGPHPRWHSGSSSSSPSTFDVGRSMLNLPLSLASQLPLLKLDSSHFELLHQWGLRTLADLAALPRQGLAERLGPVIATLHDLLHAKKTRPLNLFKPSESFLSTIHFEHSIEHAESLIFSLKRSLQTLTNRLAAHYRATSEILLQLDLEKQPPHDRLFKLPEPSADPAILLRPLATHLERLQLPAPIQGYRLTLTPCDSHAGQHQLFDRGIRHPHRLADTLTRLAALLGEERLGFPHPTATHKPDTFTLRPPHRLFHPQTAPSSPRIPRSTPRIPLSRFRPPIEIAVAFEKHGLHPRPLALLTGPHRGRIQNLHGPYPLSGHWWDPASSWQQLEWDLQLDTGHLLRLAHLPPETWNLQGTYD